MTRQRTNLLALLTAALLAIGTSAQGHEDQQDPEQVQRARLWRSLLGACPEKYRKITVYAENDDLTVVCFRSGGTTLMFRAATGKVEPVVHMKALPTVNRITYVENDRGEGHFRLWYYGQLELTVSSPD